METLAEATGAILNSTSIPDMTSINSFVNDTSPYKTNNNGTNNSSSGEAASATTASCLVFTIGVDGVLMGLIALTGIVGNILSFFTWRSVSKARGLSSSTLMLQSLAISDTVNIIPIVLVLTIPVNILLVDPTNVYIRLLRPYALHYVLPFATTANCFTIWTTFLITFHRFGALCHPFAAATKACTSVRATWIQLTVLATAAIAYNVPRFFEYTTTYDPVNSYVMITYSSLSYDPVYRVAYRNITYQLFVSAVPLFVITLLTVRILITLFSAAKARKEMTTGDSAAQQQQQQQQRSISILLITVVILFIVCQLPTSVYRIILALNVVDVDCGSSMYYLQEISLLLVIVNASSNFVIYTTCSKEFRSFLCCRDGGKAKKAAAMSASSTTRSTTAVTTVETSAM